MNKLICMMGLPRSGKSTIAKTMGYPIVSPDALRLSIYGQRFWGPGEKMVWATAHIMVRALFEAGHDVVIVDATNFNRSQRDQWKNSEWELYFKYVPTTKEVCIQRAIDGGWEDLVDIIEMMATRFEPLEEDEAWFSESNV